MEENVSQTRIENTSGRAVLVFHAWLLPGERMAMSLQAAKEAAKIAGIQIVEPEPGTGVTAIEETTSPGAAPAAVETVVAPEAVEQKPAGKRGKRGAA